MLAGSRVGARTVLILLACLAAIPTSARAAFTFPHNCITLPEDCAGSGLGAGRYGTKGISDNPRPLVGGVDTAEVRMSRVTMDLVAFPDAVCNDGSAAVFYFAAAPPASANLNKWVIQLEGGGGCLNAQDERTLHQDCMDRWTGKGPDNLDYPRLMSTDLDGNGATDTVFLPMHGKVPGLLGYDSIVTDPSNDGGTNAWNRVFINYCSSDLWTGRSGALMLSGGFWNHPIGGPQPYEPLMSAHFEGHKIIRDVLDAIKAGAISDDLTRQIILAAPPEQLVFAGESAGGGGVLANLDWLANKMFWGADLGGDRGITLGVAGATTHVPFVYNDASSPWYTGPTPVLEWDGTSVASGQPRFVPADVDGIGGQDSDQAEAGTAIRRYLYQELINAFVDQTCLARPQAPFTLDPDQRDWLCYRGSAIYPSGDISTPLLIKQDLADPLLAENTPAFAAGVVETMGNVSSNISYFGPFCARHATMSNASPFNNDQVIDPSGPRAVSYHTAIEEFIAGTYVSIHHTPGVTIAVCDESESLPLLTGPFRQVLLAAIVAAGALTLWRRRVGQG